MVTKDMTKIVIVSILMLASMVRCAQPEGDVSEGVQTRTTRAMSDVSVEEGDWTMAGDDSDGFGFFAGVGDDSGVRPVVTGTPDAIEVGTVGNAGVEIAGEVETDHDKEMQEILLQASEWWAAEQIAGGRTHCTQEERQVLTGEELREIEEMKGLILECDESAWKGRTEADLRSERDFLVNLKKDMAEKARQKRSLVPGVFTVAVDSRDQEFEAADLNLALMGVVLLGDWRLVNGLVKSGASVDCKNEIGRTCLMVVIKEGHVEVMRMLLAAGADIHARDDEGNTPLLIAAQYGTLEMVKTLLELGADRRDANKRHCTARVFAEVRRDREMLALLCG